MIDKTISHYKIIEKLGEGGMGEVYLAQDTKLKRQVAIKFLPDHLTKDKEKIEQIQGNENPDLGKEDIPQFISSAIKKCLKKKTEDRYQTLEGLLNDLRGQKGKTAPRKTDNRFAGKKRTYMTIGFAALILMLIGYILYPGDTLKKSTTIIRNW